MAFSKVKELKRILRLAGCTEVDGSAVKVKLHRPYLGRCEYKSVYGNFAVSFPAKLTTEQVKIIKAESRKIIITDNPELSHTSVKYD